MFQRQQVGPGPGLFLWPPQQIGGIEGGERRNRGGAPGVDGPLVIVVGSEDEGLARLVREHCDALVSIPIASAVESLNASVAASVALYEVSQQRSAPAS